MKTILTLSIVSAALGAAQCNKGEDSPATGSATGTVSRPCKAVGLGDTTIVVYASDDSVMTRDTLPKPRATARATKDTLPKPRSYLTCLTLYAKGDTLPKP